MNFQIPARVDELRTGIDAERAGRAIALLAGVGVGTDVDEEIALRIDGEIARVVTAGGKSAHHHLARARRTQRAARERIPDDLPPLVDVQVAAEESDARAPAS